MYYSTCRNRMRQEIFYIKISRTSVTKIPKMDPVNGTVDHQRHYRQGKCNPCDLHTPKCCQQYLSNGKEKICKPDDRQVGHSCLNDRLICCKKPKQLSRKKTCQYKQDQGNKKACAHGSGTDLSYRLRFLLSPVLAAKYDKSVSQCHKQLLKDGLYLIHGRYTG